jgi:ribosome-associated protein
MSIHKLLRTVATALEDVKGQDIRVFNTTGLSDLFDRVVVVSGNSNRQTRALASHVADAVRATGARIIGIEGTDTGEWVLVDLGDIVVHVMLPPIRAYYALEEIWGAKPVRLRALPVDGATLGVAPVAAGAARRQSEQRSRRAASP